jgi:aspartate kinase
VTAPLVVKFGGDALATPERVAAAARRLASRRRGQRVVAVASARRGVTDHLLGLVDQVRGAAGGNGVAPVRGRAAADRALASGELVAASLLALALEELGVPATVLDAREAGLRSDGRAGEAALSTLRTARLERLLARGVTPVVTGFQGWHRGRVTTLGRGGSDITAVALATALHAEACELVKDPGALHTADPRLVPEARALPRVTHRFVSEIALAGARVIHHTAATHAEREGVALRFTSLHGDGTPSTVVDVGAGPDEALAVIYATGHHGVEPAAGDPAAVATVSVVADAPDAADLRSAARAAAARAAGPAFRTVDRPYALAFLVPAERGLAFARALHLITAPARQAEAYSRSLYVGYR